MAGVAFAAARPHRRRSRRPPATATRRWAPQGCYQVRGEDQWIVLSAAPTTPSGRRAPTLIGRADLAGLTLDERRARHDELDAAIARVERAARRPRWPSTCCRRPACRPGGCSTCARSRTTRTSTPAASGSASRTRRCTRTASTAWPGGCAEANPTITRHAPYFGGRQPRVLSGRRRPRRAELDRLPRGRRHRRGPRQPRGRVAQGVTSGRGGRRRPAGASPGRRCGRAGCRPRRASPAPPYR